MTSGLHQRIVRVSGDGFDLVEVPRPGVRELHIGHSIVSRSVFVGLREAVREMKALMREAARRGE